LSGFEPLRIYPTVEFTEKVLYHIDICFVSRLIRRPNSKRGLGSAASLPKHVCSIYARETALLSFTGVYDAHRMRPALDLIAGKNQAKSKVTRGEAEAKDRRGNTVNNSSQARAK